MLCNCQKIDSVQNLSLNQEIRFTKGEILQQFNDAGTTQRYGTIVEVPTGTETNPGVGTTYKISNTTGATFDLTENCVYLQLMLVCSYYWYLLCSERA